MLLLLFIDETDESKKKYRFLFTKDSNGLLKNNHSIIKVRKAKQNDFLNNKKSISKVKSQQNLSNHETTPPCPPLIHS